MKYFMLKFVPLMNLQCWGLAGVCLERLRVFRLSERNL